MGIIEEPRIFLYWQEDYPKRDPLVLFGGSIFQNADETTKELVIDLKRLFQSLLDSIEQAYLIRFNLLEKIRGMSGELDVTLSNLNNPLIPEAKDFPLYHGENRAIRLKMLRQLYEAEKNNAIWFERKFFPPFQLFFIHWLEATTNEFLIIDLLNAIALGILNRLGLSAKAHAILKQFTTDLRITVRDLRAHYTV